MSTRRVVLFIAMSVDGYIAREDGDIEFLSSVETSGEDYGYGEFVRTVDTVIMGRKTYACLPLSITSGRQALGVTEVRQVCPQGVVAAIFRLRIRGMRSTNRGASMNRRPVSVTIVGWLFIAAGVIGIVYHASEIRLDHPFEADLLLALAVRLLAVVGGAFLLRGANWARWLLIAWMVYHVALSAFHTPPGVVMHAVLLATIAYVLCRPQASQYFRGMKESGPIGG